MAGDNGTGTNLSYTKFLFVIVRRNDEAALAKLRAAGGQMARGYFNDYDADGTRELQPHERIQFLVADGDHHADSGIAAAQYVVQVSGKYRPRLDEFEAAHTTTFERVHQALRDITRNPEWLYVEEGPLWRGRRVLKW